MNVETFTPKTQGFLNNVNRIRVSRELRRTRKGNLISCFPLHRPNPRLRMYPIRRTRRAEKVSLPLSKGLLLFFSFFFLPQNLFGVNYKRRKSKKQQGKL